MEPEEVLWLRVTPTPFSRAKGARLAFTGVQCKLGESEESVSLEGRGEHQQNNTTQQTVKTFTMDQS